MSQQKKRLRSQCMNTSQCMFFFYLSSSGSEFVVQCVCYVCMFVIVFVSLHVCLCVFVFLFVYLSRIETLYICPRVYSPQERPYNRDSTASRLLSEVKHDLARLVLRWGTTLESLVLFFFHFCMSHFCSRQAFCTHYRERRVRGLGYSCRLVLFGSL